MSASWSVNVSLLECYVSLLEWASVQKVRPKTVEEQEGYQLSLCTGQPSLIGNCQTAAVIVVIMATVECFYS